MKHNQNIIIAALVTTALLLINSLSFAATLNWSASSGEVDGYKVYYGTNPSSPSNSIDVGGVTNYSLEKLHLEEATQYFFSVTAYNAAGESSHCSPVAYAPADATPPMPPIGLNAN